MKTIGLTGAMIFVGVVGLLISRIDFSDSHTLEKLLIKRPNAGHIYGSSSRWYQGQEGWLFLGNAYNNTVAKTKLTSHPVQANIERETNTLADVVEAAKAENTAVVLLIGPNKSTLYPEYLPNQIHHSARRYVTYFTERLEGIADLTVVDPVEDLLRNKKSAGFLYYRTDTHWNDKGAFLAFSVLSNRLGWPVPDVSFEIDTPYSGDLIKISELEDFPTTAGDSWQIKWASEHDLETKPLTNQPETSFGRA